jgi:N utilization substance protein A
MGVRSMDEVIEAIIAQESGHAPLAGSHRRSAEDVVLIEEGDSQSDAYSDADAREEMIELQNDEIDTLVDESQEVSTEGIDIDGWSHS